MGYGATDTGDTGQNYAIFTNTNIPAIAGTYYTLAWNTAGRIGPIVSSRKYKDDIVSLQDEKIDSIKTIMELKPVVYTDKNDKKNEKIKNKHRHIGFIAEEVYEVLPNVVPCHPDTNEKLTVHYDRLVPVLVGALQKIIPEHEHLVNENKMLKEKCDAIETRLTNLLKVLNISYL